MGSQETDGMKIEELLEQHDHYDIGDGWSISRRKPGRWAVYFLGRHVDLWEAEEIDGAKPARDECQVFDTASIALAVATDLKKTSPWQQWRARLKAAKTPPEGGSTSPQSVLEVLYEWPDGRKVVRYSRPYPSRAAEDAAREVLAHQRAYADSPYSLRIIG